MLLHGSGIPERPAQRLTVKKRLNGELSACGVKIIFAVLIDMRQGASGEKEECVGGMEGNGNKNQNKMSFIHIFVIYRAILLPGVMKTQYRYVLLV